MSKIVFFNHYHRGDIFTNRGYVIAITESLRNFEFGYLHFNHPKLTLLQNISQKILDFQIEEL